MQVVSLENNTLSDIFRQKATGKEDSSESPQIQAVSKIILFSLVIVYSICSKNLTLTQNHLLPPFINILKNHTSNLINQTRYRSRSISNP